ncbi:Vegetative incompatibility protein HET-E-1 [Beauveria bassiana]|nr:Vegetative incompatibility protein HET-E-1 [Beauveria bassiana]
MSGAEVLGIISAVISIVDATIKVYNAAKDEVGLPPSLKTVVTKLPLVSKLLEDAERYVENGADKDLTLTFTPIVTDCNVKATQLQQLFEKVVAAEGDSRFQRYVKAARTIGKGGRVETLMKAILDNLQLLTAQFPQAVSRRGQENLTAAIEDVSKIEPSLPDGFEDAPTFANYGSGAQNNSGPGNQYIGTNHIAFGNSNSGFQAKTINGPVNYYFAQPALRHNLEAEEACRCDLFVTDPLEDKKALKRKKGDRVAGTCEWILGTEDLIAWLGPSQNQRPLSHAIQVLWLHGNPGTGKSTLAIYLTDVLSTKFSTTDGHTLAYFFCDSAFDTRRKATSVIRVLLWQLVKQHPQLLSYVLPTYNERKAKLFESFDALWTIFIAAAADRNTGRKYCIIDALDECDDESQKSLLQQLRKTFHSPDAPPNIQILVTSRPYPEIRKHLEKFTHKDLASFPDVQRDIDHCIEERVAQLNYTKKTKGQVAKMLRDKAEGTFLWIGIACNELEDTPSKDAILCLKALPSGLHSLYKELFSAALKKETEKGMIQLILSFVAVSRRPLTLLELSEACRLRQDEDDIETRTQFMREYIESCRLMVVIEDKKVLLLHQSVKDYLFKVGEQACFSEAEAHANLAYRCQDYLIEKFHNPKEAHVRLSDYAIVEWPNHARMAQSRFVVMAAQAEFFNVTCACRESWLAEYRDRLGRFSFALPHQFSILHVAARWGIPAIVEQMCLHHQCDQVEQLVGLADASGATSLDGNHAGDSGCCEIKQWQGRDEAAFGTAKE